jgi:hypothetical protein
VESSTKEMKTKSSNSKPKRKRRTKLEKQEAWARYSLARLQATPKWVDFDKIEAIYNECRAKNKKARRKLYQVDHVIPLRGKTVCGLHVHNNLQIITKKANREKSNKFIDTN